MNECQALNPKPYALHPKPLPIGEMLNNTTFQQTASAFLAAAALFSMTGGDEYESLVTSSTSLHLKPPFVQSTDPL